MNTIELQGQIHKIYNGNRNTIITLFVSGAKNNFPQIIFMMSDRNKTLSFQEGDYVHIIGTIKNRGTIGKDGKHNHTQFIRGLEISKIVVNENVREEEKESIEYINSVLINGEIVLLIKGHNLVNILIHPDGEKFNINTVQYTTEPENIFSQCQIGDLISVQCEIQTVKKFIKGEMKFFENIIIKQLYTRKAINDE